MADGSIEGTTLVNLPRPFDDEMRPKVDLGLRWLFPVVYGGLGGGTGREVDHDSTPNFHRLTTISYGRVLGVSEKVVGSDAHFWLKFMRPLCLFNQLRNGNLDLGHLRHHLGVYGDLSLGNLKHLSLTLSVVLVNLGLVLLVVLVQ